MRGDLEIRRLRRLRGSAKAGRDISGSINIWLRWSRERDFLTARLINLCNLRNLRIVNKVFIPVDFGRSRST